MENILPFQDIIETRRTQFPCPSCGQYFTPYLVTVNGISKCECKIHGLYETNNKVSKNFRIFCSKVASHPTRSQSYYTSLEAKVRDILLNSSYILGKDFIHNCLFKNGRSNYYVDFYIPRENLILECSPAIWHTLWSRDKSDKKKYKFLSDLGLKVIEVDERNYKEVSRYLERSIE
uniref:DUF559 domain-containing protein n=1 Tax=viral metagenome TaxID=1070528 RepID=A0A6M3XEV1_9ZZZZ